MRAPERPAPPRTEEVPTPSPAPAVRRRGGRPALVVLARGGLSGFLERVPAFRALAWAFPRHRRVLVCDAAVLPLVPYAGAFEDAVVAEPSAPLAPALTAPAIAVNLQGRGPWSHRRLLALGPERLVAFSHPNVPESRRGATWRAGEPGRGRWCRLLSAYGLSADADDVELIPPAHPVPPFVRGATLIHLGATHAAERWPAMYWVAVARAERQAGRPVVIAGGPDDVELANAVAAGAAVTHERVFAGRVSTLELAALVAAAARVVTGDPGVGQLALSLRRPWHRPGFEYSPRGASAPAANARVGV
jgi:glycosyl transferase family 9 (putative heptosyltransferase)